MFSANHQMLHIPNPNEVRSAIFPSLLVRQWITLRPNFSQDREIPYDTYCCSIKDDINGRTCSICGLYFNSKKTMNSHRKNLHGCFESKSKDNLFRMRLLRVHSRRPREVLSLMGETVEWWDVEAVDEEDILKSKETLDPTALVIHDV